MTARLQRRLRRAAICSALQAAIVLAAFAGVPYDAALVALVLVSLPLLWALGPFQADVSLNTALDEDDRRRWRIALASVPGAMALYWHRHLRD